MIATFEATNGVEMVIRPPTTGTEPVYTVTGEPEPLEMIIAKSEVSGGFLLSLWTDRGSLVGTGVGVAIGVLLPGTGVGVLAGLGVAVVRIGIGVVLRGGVGGGGVGVGVGVTVGKPTRT